MVTESAYPGRQDSLGLSRGIKPLAISGAGLVFFSLLIAITFSRVLAVLILLAGLGFLGYLAVTLILAKSAVLSAREANIWGGYAKIVSWNPAEGVVFLRNKQIDFVDDNPDDGGGIRLIYPFLGEEIVLRVPLEIQTLAFEDHEVLTKEYLPLSLRGTMYWKVSDIGRFYLSISREIHRASDVNTHSISTGRHPQLETAEYWLRSMAEEKTRSVVARIGTGLLIADQLSADLPAALPESESLVAMSPQSSEGYRSTTEGLASVIKSEFDAHVDQYGLQIHRVALQDMKLPADIYAAAVDACRSSYLPLKARAEAIAKKMQLQAEADVIGAEALGMKEIAGNIPALAFQEFLSPLFMDLNRKRGIGVLAATDAAMPAQH